jgi:hypothetical protein
MTDHDSPARRTPGPSARGSASRRASTPASGDPAGAAAGPTALGDRWWWSPTLSIVIGAVVIGYQLEAIRGPNPLALNWVVAGLGLAVAVYGAVGLLRAHRARRTR